MSQNKRHWLSRLPRARSLWWVTGAILLLAIVPEFFVQHPAHFEQQGIHIDASFGFFIWYSFLACVAMIVVAKLLGIFLKRRDSYYDD